MIQASVGKNAANRENDVRTVQMLINKSALLPPLRKLTVDGSAGPKTMAAIQHIQSQIMRVPDGKIDPGGTTIKALVTTRSQGEKSGKHWVSWANTHAKNSTSVDDLANGFRENVKSFIQALRDAGATVVVSTTRRSEKRAYLFHSSWMIALQKCKPADATPLSGVAIVWDHGNDALSRAGAQQMVNGFGLAVPPKSVYPPSLTSNHIRGHAIDMTITWQDTITVTKKDGTEVTLTYMPVKHNTALHQVGESYGVKKLLSDAPHWSINGK